jgi:hypothetical protein
VSITVFGTVCMARAMAVVESREPNVRLSLRRLQEESTMGRRAATSGGLSAVSVAELHRELRKRQLRVGAIVKKRDRLMAKVAALNAEISGLGGAAAGGASGSLRARPKNDQNLVQALQSLLDGKTLNVTAITEDVQKAGYQTTSPSFRTIVNQTLINNKDKFKRVSRGHYTAK